MAVLSFKMLSYDPKAVSFAFIVAYSLLGVSLGQLQVGSYSKTCPTAESIVRKVVQEAVAADPRTAAVLLRLHFHDCFVEGCDGSILIQLDNGERGAFGNQGLGGDEIIEKAKTKLERACPGVVSCADIVALAARDAVSLTQGPFYEVQTGRRDGTVSNMTLAENLPEVDDSILVLKSKFREKGLSDKDLVLLSSGAHTIGLAACFFMQKRLYSFSPGGGSDPAIHPKLLPQLKAKCPVGSNGEKIPLDWNSELIFDDQIFRNIKNGFAVIASDARLYDDRDTRHIINSYVFARNSSSFKADFAEAMVKMGNINVKTGSQGEIRRVCKAVN